MSWENVTITKDGEQLLSKMLNGSKLLFTRVVVGDKTVNNAQLSAQTSVFSPISAPALIAGKSETPQKNGTQIKIQIRNDGVRTTTRMRQIGLYARTEHDDEVLFGLLQDEIGEEIPAYEDFPQFLIELYTNIAISRTNNIQVVVSPAVFATAAELQEVQKNVAALQEAINQGGVSSASIVIPSSAAVWNTFADGIYTDVPVEGVTAAMIPIVSIAEADSGVASKCGLSSKVETLDGAVRFRAKRPPEADITAELTLLVPAGSISGGISGNSAAIIEEISASDSDVQEVINGVFGNQT